jgi:hypothetical protein
LLNIKERYYDRALDIQGPNIEDTLSSSRKWRNVESTEVATYWTIQRSDDILYEEGQGVDNS